MTLEQFARHADLVSRTETDKFAHIAFYFLRMEDQVLFSMTDAEYWFERLNYARPNYSRLKAKLLRDAVCVSTSERGKVRLHAKTIARLEQELPYLTEGSEEVLTTGSLLPKSLMKPSRGYIERLADQINASYEQNIFDGCAVLMRRLLEVLLIHTYAHHKIESQIQAGPDQYKDLKQIIADAVANKTVALSKATKDILDEFRVLGNFSAHKIIYNCRRDEIKHIAREYRAAIEELLYKSGIRT